jgi:hypothetical protein
MGAGEAKGEAVLRALRRQETLGQAAHAAATQAAAEGRGGGGNAGKKEVKEEEEEEEAAAEEPAEEAALALEFMAWEEFAKLADPAALAAAAAAAADPAEAQAQTPATAAAPEEEDAGSCCPLQHSLMWYSVPAGGGACDGCLAPCAPGEVTAASRKTEKSFRQASPSHRVSLTAVLSSFAAATFSFFCVCLKTLDIYSFKLSCVAMLDILFPSNILFISNFSLLLSSSLIYVIVFSSLTSRLSRRQSVMDCRACNYYLCRLCTPLWESNDGLKRGTFAQMVTYERGLQDGGPLSGSSLRAPPSGQSSAAEDQAPGPWGCDSVAALAELLQDPVLDAVLVTLDTQVQAVFCSWVVYLR